MQLRLTMLFSFFPAEGAALGPAALTPPGQTPDPAQLRSRPWRPPKARRRPLLLLLLGEWTGRGLKSGGLGD